MSTGMRSPGAAYGGTRSPTKSGAPLLADTSVASNPGGRAAVAHARSLSVARSPRKAEVMRRAPSLICARARGGSATVTPIPHPLARRRPGPPPRAP